MKLQFNAYLTLEHKNFNLACSKTSFFTKQISDFDLGANFTKIFTAVTALLC